MLDISDTTDPIDDYLTALRLLEETAADVDAVIPGHGSVGDAIQLRARIDQDRTYVHALRAASVPSDPRIGPTANDGWGWVTGVHERQLRRLGRRSERDALAGREMDAVVSLG